MAIKLPDDNGAIPKSEPISNKPVSINPEIPGLGRAIAIEEFTKEDNELILAKKHEEFVLDPVLHDKHFKNLSPTDSILKDREAVITYEMALEVPYKRWIHLEKAIKTIITNVQTTLNKDDKTQKITIARKERKGEVHDEMSRLINQLAANELSRVKGTNNNQENDFVIASVRNEIIGFGPLEALWLNPNVTEVMVNSPHDIYVQDQDGNHQVIGVRFRDQQHLIDFAQQVFQILDRPFNRQHAIADGSLADGSRINAMHHDLAPEGPVLTIRRFPDDGFTLMKLLKYNALSADVAVDLANFIHFKCSTVVIGGTGTGKALADDTIIPTPLGFVRMGSLSVGDYVYDAHGKPTQILGVFPQDNPECFRVSFNDGSHVIADSNHNWYVFDTLELRWRIMTTSEMNFDTFNDDAEPRYIIEGVRDVVHYPSRAIPYDAYELGVWLGLSEGDFRTKLSVPADIAQIIIKDRGESEQVLGHGFTNDSDNVLMSFPNILNALMPYKSSKGYDLTDIIMNDEKVRRDFLAGYFDIKGTANINATISSYEDEWLASQIVRMASSLGILASHKLLVSENNSSSINKNESPDDILLGEIIDNERKYLIQLSPDTPNFVRGNKSDVVNYIYGTSDGLNRRQITSITPTLSVPSTCITVDNRDSLYLFGDFYAVTHNTSMLNALSGVISSQERLITVEDTLELRIPKSKHVVRALSKPSTNSGSGGYSFRDLIKGALRMTPKRIIVGETRDGAAYDMLQSMITGHEGSLTTIHSNDAESGVRRITSLVAQSGEATTDAALLMLADGADMFVVIKHYSEDNSRRLSGIYEIPSRVSYVDKHMVLEPIPLWEFVQTESIIGEDGRHKVQGHYEKRNEISDELKRRHGLNVRKMLTLDEIFALSENTEEEIADFYANYNFEEQKYSIAKVKEETEFPDDVQAMLQNVKKFKEMPAFTQAKPLDKNMLLNFDKEALNHSTSTLEESSVDVLNNDSSDSNVNPSVELEMQNENPLEPDLEAIGEVDIDETLNDSEELKNKNDISEQNSELTVEEEENVSLDNVQTDNMIEEKESLKEIQDNGISEDHPLEEDFIKSIVISEEDYLENVNEPSLDDKNLEDTNNINELNSMDVNEDTETYEENPPTHIEQEDNEQENKLNIFDQAPKGIFNSKPLDYQDSKSYSNVEESTENNIDELSEATSIDDTAGKDNNVENDLGTFEDFLKNNNDNDDNGYNIFTSAPSFDKIMDTPATSFNEDSFEAVVDEEDDTNEINDFDDLLKGSK